MAAGALLGAASAAAAESPVEEYVSRLESAYRDTRTLKAEFVQTYISAGPARKESGAVYFARGGKMRWEYRNPAGKLFLSDGKELLLFDPTEKQLTRSRAKSSEDARVPFRLLLSHFNLHKVFGKIELGDEELKPEPGDQVLVGLPKSNREDDFSKVEMELTPTFDIHRLLIRFADHGTMEFTFDRIVRNSPVSPALFTFTPPAGTEVIDQGEGGQ